MEATIERPVLKIKKNVDYVESVNLPAVYRSTRYGVHKDILVMKIQKDKVVYKEHATDKHTSSISLAKFNKLFKPL